jgi:hypothetical protein
MSSGFKLNEMENVKEAHENYDGVKFKSVAIGAIPRSCTCWLLTVQ